MKEKFNKQETYLFSPAGEMVLLEVSELNGGVTIMIGTNRFDIDVESAIDFADILIEVTSEASIFNDK